MRIAFYAAVIASLVIFPSHTAASAADALRIWGLDVVPSLFPYMIFCRLLAARLREKNVNAPLTAAVLGLLGGSPSGASILAAYGNQLPRRTLYALCTLTGTISPMFMLGTVLSWTQDAALCHTLLLSHLLGAALASAAIYVIYRTPDNLPSVSSSAAVLGTSGNPIAQSIDAILQVGGCIICYSVLASLLRLLPFANETISVWFHGLLEVSGGVHAIAKLPLPENQRAVALAALCGFSGVSILSQNHAFLAPLGVKMKQLVLFALLRALCAGSCMALLLTFF